VDQFPSADLHFYGMIFHDWPPDRCRLFARKSFDSLPAGGRIIVHELLFNDDRTGPFPVAAFNVTMLAAMPGQQCSGREIYADPDGGGFHEYRSETNLRLLEHRHWCEALKRGARDPKFAG
jgi:hypothetical protein